jgi:hypothetical protein
MRWIVAIAFIFWGTCSHAQFTGVWQTTNQQETAGLTLELFQNGSSVCGVWWENDYGVLQAGDIKGEVSQSEVAVRRCWSTPNTGASICPNFSAEAERLILNQGALLWRTSALRATKHQFRLVRIAARPNLAEGLPDRIGTEAFVTACMTGSNNALQPTPTNGAVERGR